MAVRIIHFLLAIIGICSNNPSCNFCVDSFFFRVVFPKKCDYFSSVVELIHDLLNLSNFCDDYYISLGEILQIITGLPALVVLYTLDGVEKPD